MSTQLRPGPADTGPMSRTSDRGTLAAPATVVVALPDGARRTYTGMGPHEVVEASVRRDGSLLVAARRLDAGYDGRRGGGRRVLDLLPPGHWAEVVEG